MGQKVAKNILKINLDKKDDKNKLQTQDSEEDFEIRIDLVFPEFEIRQQNIDELFQGNSILDRQNSEYEYSKIDKSVWIQDINDEIQVNRKFGKKIQNPFWVKKFKKTQENEKLFLNELLILSNLSHPFIITEKDYFQDDDYYYIVFEDFPGVPILQYYMKNKNQIGFTQLKLMIRDLLNVIKYIHMKKIAIRNLNPSNIYYDGENLMLCNFERADFYENVREDNDINQKSKKSKNIKFQQQFIDKYLLSPEQKKKNYTYQADIWAIGLIYLVFFQNQPQGLSKKTFKIRQVIIDEFCPGFTLEQSPNQQVKMRRKSTLKFKKKLSKMLKKNKDFVEDEDVQTPEQFKQEQSILIVDLTQRQPYTELLINLLKSDPKKRLSLDNVEEQSIFADRIKLEDEQSFMDASLSIYNFLKRNDFLTPLKNFYVSNLMTYKVKSKYAKIQACFDLDGSGYLDQGEFIHGVKRTSPETTTKEAKKIYRQIDKDGNGFIEFEEFCVAFISDDFITSQQVLKQMFEYFVERDRRVVIKKKLFKQLDITSSKYKKVRELISELDLLELHSFLQFFRKIKSQLQGRKTNDKRASKFVKITSNQN